MIRRKIKQSVSIVSFIILSSLLFPFAQGAGVSEPGIQIWGKVWNGGILLTDGKLKLTLSRVDGGESIQKETRLGSFKDAEDGIYSYKIYFPMETDLEGTGISGDSLELPPSFDISYQGSIEYNLETIEIPYGHELITMTPDSRGRTIRLDFNIGDYSLGDANADGVFELQDSLFVLQCYLEDVTPDQMNEKQRSVTDANCDGEITPQDAQWIFEGFEGTRTLELCENPMPSGNVTGLGCTLVAGNTLGARGYPTTIPITVLNSPDTSSYGFLIHYDPLMLELDGVEDGGTASEGWFGLGSFERAPGVAVVGAFRGSNPGFTGDQLAINVLLYVKPDAIGDIPIMLSDPVDDFAGAATIPGNVRVTVRIDSSLWLFY